MDVQPTFRIRHKGVESTPFTIQDLRQMWKSGHIDTTTEFKRGDATQWLRAEDLRSELETPEPAAPASSPAAAPTKSTPFSYADLKAIAPHSVRLVSVRIPFKEILVLLLKFYLAALVLAGAFTLLGWLLLRFIQ